VYWVRNIAYHLPGGSTRLTNGSAGVLFYNNTILSETTAEAAANVHWRNNLFLGENSQPVLFDITTATAYSSSDYNGFRPNPGTPVAFRWNAARKAGEFGTLEAYAAESGQDRHSVLVDYDVFRNVPKLDRNDVKTVQRVYRAEDYDFRLRPGSAAVDRGISLANVADRFRGAAPDLGAIEEGEETPHYGPRP
jgi:hypothetical protein